MMKVQSERNFMSDTTSYPSDYSDFEEPHDSPGSVLDEEEGKPRSSSEPLEVQITNRAQQISQQRNGLDDKSLASWLEAAREILAEDSGKHS